MRFLLRLAITAIAIWFAASLLSGIDIASSGHGTVGNILVLLGLALVFTVVNALVRPVVTLFSLPLLILTLGLFTLVINALMLLLTAWISDQTDYGMTISGFWTAVLGAIVISVVNFVLSAVVPEGRG